MNIALFVTFVGRPERAADLRAWFRGEPAAFLHGRPEVDAINLFRPDLGDIPRFDDGVGPPLIVQIDVRSSAAARQLIQAPDFATLIMESQLARTMTEQIQLDVFETLTFPIGSDQPSPARIAPLSFVVRYYRPTQDEAEFADFYIADHPPLMKHFPGIRNIRCYVCHTVEVEHAFPDSGAFFGNEVVFDDLAALNAALASDVLPRLKAGLRTFKPFGYNTHYAMLRQQLVSHLSGSIDDVVGS